MRKLANEVGRNEPTQACPGVNRIGLHANAGDGARRQDERGRALISNEPRDEVSQVRLVSHDDQRFALRGKNFLQHGVNAGAGTQPLARNDVRVADKGLRNQSAGVDSSDHRAGEHQTYRRIDPAQEQSRTPGVIFSLRAERTLGIRGNASPAGKGVTVADKIEVHACRCRPFFFSRCRALAYPGLITS